jgi:hypothetical protein
VDAIKSVKSVKSVKSINPARAAEAEDCEGAKVTGRCFQGQLVGIWEPMCQGSLESS